MRTLYLIPIIHTNVDLGALGDAVTRAKISLLGRQGTARSNQQIDTVWRDIEKAVDAIPVESQPVRVYQDGLPVSGQFEEIVKELIKSGSPNYALLQRLRTRGALLMGTESPELLVREYELARNKVRAEAGRVSVSSRPSRERESDAVLKQRDQFIAERINSTLQEGEIGILFLGMLHSVEPNLAPDIQVHFPMGRKSRI